LTAWIFGQQVEAKRRTEPRLFRQMFTMGGSRVLVGLWRSFQ